MVRRKIALVGGGSIGTTLANLAIQRQLGEVILINTSKGVTQGKALDLCQAAAIDGIGYTVTGTQDYSQLESSDVVIVTASIARNPTIRRREDLLQPNSQVIQLIGQKINQYCPQAFVIVVTNPLDAMVWLMQQSSKLPHHQVVGMAGILDSGRFRYFLAKALKVSVKDVQTFVLGGHNDTMVVLLRYTTVGEVPLQEWIDKGKLSQSQLDDMIVRTKKGGAEIARLMRPEAPNYAPASAALQMAEAYLFDQKRILPCAAWLNGEYGLKDIYAGVPVIIGAKGVEKIVELKLNEEEKQQFFHSVQEVKKLIDDLKDLSEKG